MLRSSKSDNMIPLGPLRCLRNEVLISVKLTSMFRYVKVIEPQTHTLSRYRSDNATWVSVFCGWTGSFAVQLKAVG
jgi:hypothetical protein